MCSSDLRPGQDQGVGTAASGRGIKLGGVMLAMDARTAARTTVDRFRRCRKQISLSSSSAQTSHTRYHQQRLHRRPDPAPYAFARAVRRAYTNIAQDWHCDAAVSAIGALKTCAAAMSLVSSVV